MPVRNKYLDNFIPHIYQRQIIDVMAFTFIDTYRFVYPTVTLKEASLAFMKRYNISEDLHNVESIIMTYNRVLKDFYDNQKTKSL